MKLLQRRMRISWGWLLLAVFFSIPTILSLADGSYTRPKPRLGGDRKPPIERSVDPQDYWFRVGIEAAIAGTGWLFAFYQFRRGSWFNPI